MDANRNVDGEVKSIEIVYTDDGESQSVPVANAGKSGTLVVPAGVAGSMPKADIRSKTRLDGKEAITLKIDNQPLNPASESATARIDNFENCVVLELLKTSMLRVCITDDQAKNATFKFEVELSVAGRRRPTTTNWMRTERLKTMR